MKAFCVTVALVVAAARPLPSQSRITAIAGYSIDRMLPPLGDAGTPIASVSGFVPGVGLTVGLSNRVGLTAEALYVHKGYSTVRNSPGEVDDSSTFALDVRYLEFPLLLTARYPFGKAQIVVLGGATLAVRNQCSATIYRVDGTQVANDCVHTDSGEVVPSTDIALTGGFGLAWGRFTLTGQYEFTGKDMRIFPGALALEHRTLILMLSIDLLKGKDR